MRVSYLLKRVIAGFIFFLALSTRDPLILPFAALALVAVALVACYIPARRATRVDPLVALKSD